MQFDQEGSRLSGSQLKEWLMKLVGKSEEAADLDYISSEERVELKGRLTTRMVRAEQGLSVLELAQKNDIEWSFECKKGLCARCRCYVSEGRSSLTEPNEKEIKRLDPGEITSGYRLGCQARIIGEGKVSITLTPY